MRPLKVLRYLGNALRRWAVRPKADSFFRHVCAWSFAIAFLVGLPVSDWVAALPVFQAATLQLDAQIVREVMESRKQDARHVVLVTIDAHEHARFFDSRIPLDPQKLMVAVERLLQEAPAVLVMDVDTEHSSFSAVKIPAAAKPVVWARVIDESPVETGVYRSRPILGGNPSDSDLPPGHTSGIAAYGIELDFSIRRFDRSFVIERAGLRRTLAEEAVCQFRSTCGQPTTSSPQRVRLFHHHYDFVHRPIGEFLDSKTGSGKEFADKIVVFGMSESHSDMHRTVVGEHPGMWLVASAIEHELNGAPGQKLEGVAKLGIELLLSLIIAFIHSRLRPRAALLSGLVILGALVYYGAWLALWVAGYEASVVPLVLGIVLEQLSSTAEHGEAAHPPLNQAEAVSIGSSHANP